MAQVSVLPNQDAITRRQLLRWALLGTVGAAGVPVVAGFVRYLQTPAEGPMWAGSLADFPVGSVVRFSKGKFFLVRTDQGLVALSWHNQAGCGGTVDWKANDVFY